MIKFLEATVPTIFSAAIVLLLYKLYSFEVTVIISLIIIMSEATQARVKAGKKWNNLKVECEVSKTIDGESVRELRSDRSRTKNT